eukprot:TRINITY_DN465_c0_g1_i1.p1 TRINITY_DN465_c0_g1~~TRINITY_DN465_c0_g1_i1.p1  ORF type:complete len:475 (+),score=91.10 TRINITY_DN465_c0_g1_i1:83-1507(+)
MCIRDSYNTTHALVLQIRGLKASFLPCLFNKTRAFCDGRAYLKPLIPHVKLINSMITLERGALHYFAKVAWGNSALYTSFFAGRLTSGPQEKALLARIRKVALAIITDQEAVDQNAVKIQRMIRQLHARVRDGKFQMKLPTDAIPINSQVDLNPASDLSGAITIRNGQWAHLLSNGIVMPSKIYSGAHFRDRNNEFKLFSEALKAGWRHFDVAQDYFPAETVLGRVIANSTVPRSSIFITDKLSYPKDYTRARAVILGQMKQLKVDYIDCYMLYAPGHTLAAEKAAWRDMEALYHEGKIKSLGVSEFDVVKMKRLLSYAKVKPHVLQNHFNMFLPGAHFWSHQPDGLFELCKKHGIAFTSRRMLAYSDMLHMKPMLEPHLIPLMAKYKKTAAQILYRWSMHIGVGVVSKTEVVARMKEDLETLDWQLDEADVRQIREIGAYARPAQEATLNKQKTLKWIKEMSDLKEESQRRVS